MRRYWYTRLRVSRVLVRDTALMYSSAVASGGVQYLALIIMARSLGPSSLGVVVFATTIGSFAAAACELGIGPVLIRFRPQLEKADPELWSAIVRSMARIVLIAVLGVLCVGVVMLLLSEAHGPGDGIIGAAAFGATLAAPTVLLTFFQSYLQSGRRFHSIAALGVGSAGLRLVLIAGLALMGSLTAHTALATYLAVVSFAALGTWTITLRQAELPRVSSEARRRARSLARPYLRWTIVGRSSAALYDRLGIFLLSAMAGTRTTGVYGGASQSASPVTMLAGAVGEVSFPHLVARAGTMTPRAILGRWVAWLPIFVASGAGLAVGGAYLLPAVLGPEYQRSAAPFATLVIAYSVQVWLQPISSILYASDRQQRAAAITVVQLGVLTTSSVVLIPVLGAFGAAVAVLIATVFSGPMMIVAVLHRQPDVSDASHSTLGADASHSAVGARP
jgi:O-antigen/teichoic acid export membrane protein